MNKGLPPIKYKFPFRIEIIKFKNGQKIYKFYNDEISQYCPAYNWFNHNRKCLFFNYPGIKHTLIFENINTLKKAKELIRKHWLIEKEKYE